jgi:hypothetical protein
MPMTWYLLECILETLQNLRSVVASNRTTRKPTIGSDDYTEVWLEVLDYNKLTRLYGYHRDDQCLVSSFCLDTLCRSFDLRIEQFNGCIAA